MLGTRLGPYELLEEVGRGGMATVYRAYQASIERHVAVKVIHKTIVNDEVALHRFRREARLIARLEHPHIVPIYDFDGTNDPPYIVMRYLDSGTLGDTLAQRSLSVAEVGVVLRQIAGALDYAHQQGIVHRDVKPSNILLDRQGNVVVSDLGIARMMSGAPGARKAAETAGVVGTPFYMAPEQVLGKADLDGRVDVYALGVMLFQLLTGQLPFVSDEGMAVMLMHLTDPPPSATGVNPTLPAGIDAVLAKALAKEREARQRTAGELAAEAMAVLDGAATKVPRTPSVSQALIVTGASVAAKPRPDSQTTPTEQNRIVTAVHADVAEYAELVEATDGAEAARRAVHAFWERGREIVAARGGRILARGATDALAVWGVDAAREDDAERALRAALDLQTALRALGVFEESDDEPLPLKIGVNTGLVHVTLAEKEGVTASGATITLAQRLAEQAHGPILITRDTFRAVYGVFVIQPDEPLKVRGKKEKIETYGVTGAKPRAFHRVVARSVEGVETRLVGRDAELKQLQHAFLNAVEEKETQVITLLGDAGVGKSRLLDEFEKWAELRPEKWRVFHGRATPAMTNSPYALLRDLLSLRFEIFDDDAEAVARAKMERGVRELAPVETDETAHLLGHLAGFDFSDSPHIRGLLGDAKQLGARARQLFIRFFAGMGAAGLLFEDLHWADDATLDLLTELIDAQPDLPLFVVGAARPALVERRPGWGTGQRARKLLHLDALDKHDSRDLARELLQKLPDPPKVLRDLLVARAEGNPLFMEELVKLLLEDRVILAAPDVWRVEESRLAALRVPPSLAGLLQARIDTLLYPEQLTLQRAAVVGKVFSEPQLAALDQTDEAHVGDLPLHLAKLAARGFIGKRDTSAEYLFAQAMLRDLLYDTMIERQRRGYHAALARWFAGSERADEYLPVIAEHHEKAGEAAQAAAFFERAGDKAMRVSAFTDARGFFEKALAAGGAVHLKLAEALYRLADFPPARAHVQRALELSTTDADRAAALALSGELSSSIGDYPAARAVLEEALPLARRGEDRAALAQVLYALADVHWRQGNAEIARAYINDSIDLARVLGDMTRLMFALSRLGTLSEVDEAERLFKQAHQLALAAGNRERAMMALANLSAVADRRGDLPTARRLVNECLVIARELGAQQAIVMHLLNGGSADIQLGNLAAARRTLREALLLARRLGALAHVVSVVKNLGVLAKAEGDLAGGLALIGVARRHPAFSSEDKWDIDLTFSEWGLSAADAEAGMKQSEGLDFDAVVDELLRT